MTDRELMEKALNTLEALFGKQRQDLPTLNALRDRLAQPEREWVGLTDEELKDVCDPWEIASGGWVKKFYKDIEEKLKEKNT